MRRVLCILAVMIGSSLVSLTVSGLFVWNAGPTPLTNQFHSITLVSLQSPVHKDTSAQHDGSDVLASRTADINADSSYNSKQVNSVSSSDSLPQQDVEEFQDDDNALNPLPESVINGVKTFVFFIGHCRSGHSIVGSILDSHPHIVISHESKLFQRLLKRSEPDKSYIFNTIWNSSYLSATTGIRTAKSNGKGYTLAVNDLYQGTYESYIDVIGEKKAELTTEMFLYSPARLQNIINKLQIALGLPMKVFLVIRNPFDNIATAALFKTFKDSQIGKVKRQNITIKVNSSILNEEIDTYFRYLQAVKEANEMFKFDLMVIHGKDFVANPRTTIAEMCKFLEIQCSDDYLDITSKKVFNGESKTRYKIKWEDYQISRVQSYIDNYSSLKRYYDFDS